MGIGNPPPSVGPMQKVMKSGVSKCTCLRSYRGAKEQVLSIRYLYGLFYVILCGVREQDCFAHRVLFSGSVNRESRTGTFYRVDPDCLVQTLDDGPTDRLPEYSAFEIY